MKKVVFCILAAGMLLTFNPLQSNAATTKATNTLTVSKEMEEVQAKALLLRLDEIKAMDKSNLKPSEKHVLRKEVRAIKHTLTSLEGGVYISVGGLLIIIILLVIFL